MSRAHVIRFPGASGASLAGLLILPTGPTRAWALFAHCFTCGKDLGAAQSIGDALAARGIAVLRFDFTGLGESEGEFAETTFSSNADDLVAAADWLRREHAAPAILVGHSLGGAAALAAAHRMPEVKAVATIGAPADPIHVRKLIDQHAPELEAKGEAELLLAGRRLRIKRAFLEDLEGQAQAERVAKLRRALLILHAPLDQVVGVDNARQLFVAAKHPKSFVSLDGADHLLSRPADGEYVGGLIAAWASRYLPPLQVEAEHGVVEVVGTEARFRTSIQAGAHHLIADEPRSLGGTDTGPGPYEFLLGGLGACTTMTLRMYADRKGWPLTGARVRLTHRKVHATDCGDCETKEGRVDEIERRIVLEGQLSDEQRARLMEIADRCPVHRTLEGETKVRTQEGSA